MKIDKEGKVALNIVEKEDMELVRDRGEEMETESILRKIKATKRKVDQCLYISALSVLFFA